jgi:hypothetical protein
MKKISNEEIITQEDILAYCGYKLVGKKLVFVYYEPNPNLELTEYKKILNKKLKGEIIQRTK